MNLLISWSKAQSKTVALALYDWLPSVLPGIKPWMSTKDIDKGRDWFRELQNKLSEIHICLICVTPENVRSPWIYYEAGAIAVRDSDVLIFPYLIGVSSSMLSDGPLGKWQCTVAEEDDTWELIKSLNVNALSSRHDLSLLEGNYRTRWSVLLEKLQPILQSEEDVSQGFVQTDVDYVAGVNLSPEARMMLIEMSQDSNGIVMYTETLNGGTQFEANGKKLCQDQSARSVARWKNALDTLIAYELLERRDSDGAVFALTDRGFKSADILSGNTIS
jgi:hypothetical protein